MPRAKTLTSLTLLLATALPAFAGEEAGIAPKAEGLFNLGPIPISNSIVTSWIVAAVIILIIRLAARRPKLRPSGGQIVVENLVEGILDLTSPIVGPKVAKATFPLLVGLFTFILMQNWSGLFPGVAVVRNQSENPKGDFEHSSYVYPNPVDGDSAHFVIFTPFQADVKMRIYTMSGELVLDKDFGEQQANNYVNGGSSAGGVPCFTWTRSNSAGRRVARGVYYAVIRVEATDGSRNTMQTVKKFLVR